MSGTVNDAVRLVEEFSSRSDGAYNNILIQERNNIQMLLRELGHPDPDDEKMITRMQTINDGHPHFFDDDGNMKPADDNVVTFTPKNWEEWVQRKLSLSNLVDYIAFRLTQVDVSDPVKAQYWNEKYPWLYQLREKQVEVMAERQKKFAKIAIKGGPTTEEDFKFLYLIMHGAMEMSGAAVHKLALPDKSEKLKAAHYLDMFFKNNDKFVTHMKDPIDRNVFPGDPGKSLRGYFDATNMESSKFLTPTKDKFMGKSAPNEISFNQV